MGSLITAVLLLAISVSLSAGQFPLDHYRFQRSYPPGDSLIKLEHNFIIPNSDELEVSGIVLMRNQDYQIDCLTGKISLNFLPEDTIIVNYQVYPFNLRRYYYHRMIPQSENIPQEKPSPLRLESEIEQTPFVFRRSGSIYRSITIGSNRDASLESGMQLNLNGRLGKGTTITAVLSDQNVPLQPEGNTRTLDEIDKVYVQIESGQFGLNLGDYNLEIKDREFASLNRKLTGVQGKGRWERFAGMISGAASKGEFRSESFNGIEGLQGPYQLHGGRGETGILILAGTERVWLDGIRLTRGEDYDYIIDYSQGEITFTERLPISTDSRIVVDFEYSSGEYSRNLYHSAGEAYLHSDKLRLHYALASESDSKGNPLSLALTDSDKEIMKSAGNDPFKAAAEGAEYVGEGEGDYLKIAEGDSFKYQWAGREQGDYDVLFSFIGDNQGSYTRRFEDSTGYVYYDYSGFGLADYEPLILLPLPQSHNTADIGIDYKPGNGFYLKAETALSQRDLNTYSGVDDEDNTGMGFSGAGGYDSLKLPQVGNLKPKMNLRFKTRLIDDDFHPLERSSEVEYDRKWGYRDTLSQKEESYELRMELIPCRGLMLLGGGGGIVKTGFSSQRYDGGLNYSDGGITAAVLALENIRTDIAGIRGHWRRANGDIWRRIGLFKPGFWFRAEDKLQGGGGYRYGEFKPSAKIGHEGGLTADYTYREDESRQAGASEPLSTLNRYHLNYEKRFDRGDVTLDYTRSERDYKTPDSAGVNSDIGRIELNSLLLDDAVDVNFQHRITQSRTADIALIPIEVGYGEGTHVKIGGQYYPDPNGDYLLLTQQTGEFTRSAKVQTTIDLRLNPGALKALKNLPQYWKLLRSETYLSLNEESRTGEPWKLYLLYLPEFRGDSTLYGTQSFRQDIFYRKGDRDFSLRLRYFDNRSLNNRLQFNKERRILDEYSIRVWKSLTSRTNLQSELLQRRERKWLSSAAAGDFHTIGSENLIIHQLSRPVELRMRVEGRASTDKVSDISVRIFSLSPQLDYSIFKKGKIIIDGAWTGVYSASDNIPYEIGEGSGRGNNYTWGVRVSLRVGKNLNMTASYSGESKVNRPVIHTGRMELRAFF